MSTAEKARFHELVASSQQLCEALLEASPGNRDARYFLGALHGVLGSFAITIDRSRTQAFKHGKKAYRYHIDLIREDPSYYDAYMTAGVYEYVVGSLPWYLKFVAALVGYRGSKKRGFEYLSLAVDKGRFISDNARTVQLVLLVREKRYEDALSSLQYLKSNSPKNFVAYLNEARLLQSLGRYTDAALLYQEVVTRARMASPTSTASLWPPFAMPRARSFSSWETSRQDWNNSGNPWVIPRHRSENEPCHCSPPPTPWTFWTAEAKPLSTTSPFSSSPTWIDRTSRPAST